MRNKSGSLKSAKKKFLINVVVNVRALNALQISMIEIVASLF
jgi:hypothetical protein